MNYLDPWGPLRNDLGLGILSSIIAASKGVSKSPLDFMPFAKVLIKQPQSEAVMKEIFDRAAAGFARKKK